jgi:hypothetical protein
MPSSKKGKPSSPERGGAVRFTYGFEFVFKKVGEPGQDCKLTAPKDAVKLPLPKKGDEVTFAWEGEERSTHVQKWRFDYTVNKGRLTGLHVAIVLESVMEPGHFGTLTDEQPEPG